MNKNFNKTFIILVVDSVTLTFSLCFALLFRFYFSIPSVLNLGHVLTVLCVSMIGYSISFFLFKVHRVIWRYASLSEMIRLAAVVFLGALITMSAVYLGFGFHIVPLSILPLQAFFYMGGLVLTRSLYRLYRQPTHSGFRYKKVLLIGGGRAAEGLIRDMQSFSSDQLFKPVAILDDDPELQQRAIHNVPVVGFTSTLKKYLQEASVDLIVIAIPSLNKPTFISDIYTIATDYQVPVRTLPGLQHMANGRVSIDELRCVSIEDLLGREVVNLQDQNLVNRFNDKVVMVTGGGGSIGSELCRQIALNQPHRLVIVENNEYNLYRIHRELKNEFPTLIIEALLIDVANKIEINRVFATVKPHIVFHAAAFKHVPMLEYQVGSAVKNNVLATRHLADLADQYRVKNFILVSTDKAVNPTNVMGMSKRIGEIYCQNKNNVSQTNYSTVRFGNVLGSAGSVLPLFREQLEKGGPLTVTDAKMTRYFMMIPEAVSLILQSFLLGEGGEIFVLDMGQPVKILDLAEKLIRLSGKRPYDDIDITITGIRPGEKLFEELFYGSENLLPTPRDKIFKAKVNKYDWHSILDAFTDMEQSFLASDQSTLLSTMTSLVPEYQGKFSSSPVLV